MPSENGTQWRYPFLDLRRTGRTTRMMTEASRLARTGKRVVVWAPCTRTADHLAQTLLRSEPSEWSWRRTPNGVELRCQGASIRILTWSTVSASALDGLNYTLVGERDTEYLADHSMLERAEPWLLMQWERFRNA